MLFSIDSTEIYSIPIPWIAIGMITGVSLLKLFTYEADLEMKVVFIVFILLFIQNTSSFLAYDSYDELFSQHTYLRFLNFISKRCITMGEESVCFGKIPFQQKYKENMLICLSQEK